MTLVLYALHKNEDKRYMEDVLCETTKYTDIEKVKIAASKDGFHSFRVAKIADDMPDFVKSVRV